LALNFLKSIFHEFSKLCPDQITIEVENRTTISVMSLKTSKMAVLGDDSFGNLVYLFLNDGI
jgi:hypothetical protein